VRIRRRPRFVTAEEADFKLRRHAAWLQRVGKVRRPSRHARPKLFAGPERIYRRRSVIKASFVRNFKNHQWREGAMQAHARYLEQDGYGKGHKELGFDATSDQVDVLQTAKNWALAKDWIHWRFILSPENHEQVNLPEHARAVIAQMEQDLGTSLRWVAVLHRNTDHQHVHIFLRGVRDEIDEKTGKRKVLGIPRDYLAYGIREISERLIEQELGPRSEREYLEVRGHGIEGLRWTELDRTIERKSDLGVVDYSHAPWVTSEQTKARLDQEMERLAFLEGFGLAERRGDKRWELRPDWKDELKQLQLDGDVVNGRGRVHSLRRQREREQLEREL
jgi:type IV secretory pathway VirD2 relaxase